MASLCELTGPQGSGQTSIALSLLSHASSEGACAYIDVSDRLSPQSAAAAGIQINNLLWVRFAASAQVLADFSVPKSMTAAPVSRQSHRPIGGRLRYFAPRGETKGLAPALEQMLFDEDERRSRKMEGTPGHPNQPLGLHTASKDQVDWERFNLRQVDETDPLRVMDKQAAEAARQRAFFVSQAPSSRKQEHKPWDRLGCALRATDQVLQSGRFRAVVLDLASVSPQEALCVPSATWFRFRRATQESDAIPLLLTQEPCARSSAACVLACSTGAPPVIQGVLTEAPRTAEVARQRTAPAFGKKAPGRETGWCAAPTWMREGAR